MNRSTQARLLFTLLDAAEVEGRILDPILSAKWHALKARFEDTHSEQQHATLEALIEDLDRGGALSGTWIQARWFAAKARGETNTPFPKGPPPGRSDRPAG